MLTSKPYWHEASEEEVKALMESGGTWKDVMDKFDQPEWCHYPEALRGRFGCSSLIIPETRTMICPAYCKDCDCFINEE